MRHSDFTITNAAAELQNRPAVCLFDWKMKCDKIYCTRLTTNPNYQWKTIRRLEPPQSLLMTALHLLFIFRKQKAKIVETEAEKMYFNKSTAVN